MAEGQVPRVKWLWVKGRGTNGEGQIVEGQIVEGQMSMNLILQLIDSSVINCQALI